MSNMINRKRFESDCFVTMHEGSIFVLSSKKTGNCYQIEDANVRIALLISFDNKGQLITQSRHTLDEIILVILRHEGKESANIEDIQNDMFNRDLAFSMYGVNYERLHNYLTEKLS